MSRSTVSTSAELVHVLLKSANPDGGWGYHHRQASRLEPTCWSVLALIQNAESHDQWRPNALWRLFEQWQRRRGLLAEKPSMPPNLAFNGLAALTVLHAERVLPDHRAALESIRETLLPGIRASRGIRLPDSASTHQDNSLQGWGWLDDAFSWVEPTSMCTLALKKARQWLADTSGDGRIDEGQRLLLDRSCWNGGWNYGNAEVFGQQLSPYVPTTALALLALRDHAEHPIVARGIDFLSRSRTAEVSGMALALAAIGLRAYGRHSEDVETRLERQVSTTIAVGNLANVAMAAVALGGTQHGVEPFVLPSHPS
jgi:hypothetical protein